MKTHIEFRLDKLFIDLKDIFEIFVLYPIEKWRQKCNLGDNMATTIKTYRGLFERDYMNLRSKKGLTM